MDVETIEPGVNFGDLIEETLDEVEVLIAVIGRGWLTAVDAEGRRRLDDHQDWVRLEIAQALERDIRVVPVLVNGATLPGAGDLPDDLSGLRARNALELKAADWRAGVERLVASLERLIGRAASAPGLSPDRPATETPKKARAERSLASFDRLGLFAASEPALPDAPATGAPRILLQELNPGERLEDWFDADATTHATTGHYVIGITATRLLVTFPDAPGAKPISADFARVTSVSESSDRIHAGGLRLDLTNGGWVEFIPRRDINKLLSELRSRVEVASA